jgi:hypothetical protein
MIFDINEHGDSHFNIGEVSPAQRFPKGVTVFDWMRVRYLNRRCFEIGSRYGDYLAGLLM